MRGGTSRGPYFNAADLPSDRDTLADVLIAVMGAGSSLQTDGIGGGAATTSKVAILSRSEHDWADIDFFFAQVHAEKAEVDFSPSCGNILAGVGPAALEMGLMEPSGSETSVKIRSVNTETLVEATVKTPEGVVSYEGETAISGIPGTAAPIVLNFMDIIGSKTGALFPTGNRIDVINGVEVTCIDVAVPMVIARAADFGITGYETREELDGNKILFDHFEPVRIKAGRLMGLGDVEKSVVPRFAFLAGPRQGGSVAARYFMPWRCHPAYSVTGAICTGTCLLASGTVAEGLPALASERPTPVEIEHPSGIIDVLFDYEAQAGRFDLKSAGLLRTARKLFSGTVSIPSGIWLR